MKRIIVSLMLAVAAAGCSAGADGQVLARYTGTFDATTGAVSLTSSDDSASSAVQAITSVPVPDVENGVVGDAPPGSVELLTFPGSLCSTNPALVDTGTGPAFVTDCEVDQGIPPGQCGADQYWGSINVAVISGVGSSTFFDTAVRFSGLPAEHALCNPETPPNGIAADSGVILYGDLAPGGQLTKPWFFVANTTTSFGFNAEVLANEQL